MVVDQPSQDEPHPSSIRHCVVFGIEKLIGSLRISTISEKNDPKVVLKSIHQCVEQARFETEPHGKQGIYAAISQRLAAQRGIAGAGTPDRDGLPRRR